MCLSENSTATQYSHLTLTAVAAAVAAAGGMQLNANRAQMVLDYRYCISEQIRGILLIANSQRQGP